jgi:hypothetical protein
MLLPFPQFIASAHKLKLLFFSGHLLIVVQCVIKTNNIILNGYYILGILCKRRLRDIMEEKNQRIILHYIYIYIAIK